MTIHIARTAQLADLETRAAKREVVAYAAVFDTPTEIRDQHGHYWESIGRSAFNESIRGWENRTNPKSKERNDIRAMVNHGRNIYGQPSERWSEPYGTVTSMTPDGRGLLTVTRVAKTDLGDTMLELLSSGALDGFSFSGHVLKTNEIDPVRTGDLPTLVRQDIVLREFGPAVWAAYPDAQLVAVRSGEPVPLPHTSDGDLPSASSTDADDAPASGSAVDRTSSGDVSPPQEAAGRTPNAAALWLRDNLR